MPQLRKQSGRACPDEPDQALSVSVPLRNAQSSRTGRGAKRGGTELMHESCPGGSAPSHVPQAYSTARETGTTGKLMDSSMVRLCKMAQNNFPVANLAKKKNKKKINKYNAAVTQGRHATNEQAKASCCDFKNEKPP